VIRNITLLAVLLVTPVVHAQNEALRLKVREGKPGSKTTICDIGPATFVCPSEWQVTRSGPPSIAILVEADEKPGDRVRLISIDVGGAKLSSAKETATAFAKNWMGKLRDEKLMADGVEAFHVVVEQKNATLKPSECVVFHHEGRAYLIIGGTKGDESTSETLKSIITSWKWKQKKPSAVENKSGK
jgi:hypothetical protein